MYFLVVFLILMIFCKLKEQFLLLWEKFYPTPGNSTIIFGSGVRELDKKIAWVAGIRSLKKISPPVARGDVPSWN